MADFEKVIKGLQTCVDGECKECPYGGTCSDAEDFVALARDALEILKAQQPRVLTLEELWQMEHKLVYLQRKNSRSHIAEHVILLKAKRCYVPCLGESYIFMREHKVRDTYWACDYNVTWRCWTSHPTDEQRKEVKWND